MAENFGSFFSDVGGGEGERCNYTTRLDTYGKGCAHARRYCYAKSLLDFRKMWDEQNPSVASTVEISKALKKANQSHTSIGRKTSTTTRMTAAT